jgi:hypothetical protein
LELERRWIVWQAWELRDNCLERAEKELKKFELRRSAICNDHYAPIRLRHADHFAQRSRLIRYQHHTEQRPGYVEAIIRQVQ